MNFRFNYLERKKISNLQGLIHPRHNFDKKLQDWAARNNSFLNTMLSLYINIDRNETSVRPDSSSYRPYLMWGHPNMDIFPLLSASKCCTNPVNTCPVVIKNSDGQAPTSLDPFNTVLSPFANMSPHEISCGDMYHLSRKIVLMNGFLGFFTT